MRDLAPGDRPREKLARLGAPSLGDNELTAIVIGSGSGGRHALALATEVLARVGGLHGLARAGVDQLAAVAGIGRAKGSQLVAAVELGRRTLTEAAPERLRLRAPRDAAAYLIPAFSTRPVEHFGIVLLDTRHRVLRTSVLAVGSLNSAVVQPREVFREAALGAAAAIIVFHNHPSGDPSPSPDDVELTKRLVAAGTLMGIDVIDHVIVGDGRYCSFKETGRL